jgi:hypothetical protein
MLQTMMFLKTSIIHHYKKTFKISDTNHDYAMS